MLTYLENLLYIYADLFKIMSYKPWPIYNDYFLTSTLMYRITGKDPVTFTCKMI